MNYKLNWIAGLVDIVIILSSLWLQYNGVSNWWLFLVLLVFTGGYVVKGKVKT